MTAAVVSPQTFCKAKTALQKAHASYTEAQNERLEAKFTLENDRADLLAAGVEGKNADVRDASIRLALFDQYAHLLGCEAQLNDARLTLEHARLDWDCLRYRLRIMESLSYNAPEVAA